MTKTTIHCVSKDVKQAYEDLHKFVAHDGKTHRRVDTCDAVSRKIVDDAWNCIEEADEGQDSCKGPTHWGETGSVFASAASQRSSSKKQEAAVELATTEATLKADRALRDSQEDECCKSTSSASCGTTTKFHKCTRGQPTTGAHREDYTTALTKQSPSMQAVSQYLLFSVENVFSNIDRQEEHSSK